MERYKLGEIVEEIKSSAYSKAKKRMEGFVLLPGMLVSLSKDFPTALVSKFEHAVFLCTIQYEDWSEDKILYHVAEEFDKRLVKLERNGKAKETVSV